MKILLSQRLPCFPALTGAAKATLHLLSGLVERGHSCRLIALASSDESRFSSELDIYDWCGVEIHAVSDGYHLWTHLAEQIRQFDPGCVFIGEDPTFLGLATALQEAGAARVVYLAHSQATLPFGPEAFFPDAAKTDLLGRAAAIVAPSCYLRDYIRRWSGLRAEVLQLPAYGSGPFPDLGNFDSGFVTLVNASQLKGVCILEELARLRPKVDFAAVPTWATTPADVSRLSALHNVQLLPPSEDIEAILSKTRVLIVPSLWGEAFGRIVVEAMLRGIPVLASSTGGLPEAKLGVDYLLPVRPIRTYSTQRDDRGLPIPLVPEQDVTPWLDALDRLLSTRGHYGQVSSASRAAALHYVAGLTMAPCEELLHQLEAGQGSGSLSQERRDLLEVLLRERAARAIE
jgi:hypothetical protein